MAIRAETQVDLARVDDGYSPTATVTKTGDTATITITDKNQTTTASISDGDEGVSITSVKPQYYLSTSSSSATGGSWSDTPQAFENGKYYWTRDYIDYSDGTHDTSTAVYNAALTQANQEALEANTKADNVAQYFWFNSTDSGAGEGAGAHITEIPREDFVDDPSLGGFNLLLDSIGMKIRNGITTLATYGQKLILGKDDEQRVEISDTELNMKFDNRFDAFKVLQADYNTSILLYADGFKFVDGDSGEWAENPRVFRNSGIALANTSPYYSKTIRVKCEFDLQRYTATFQAGTTSTVTFSNNYTLTYTYVSATECSLTLGGPVDMTTDQYVLEMSYYVVGHEALINMTGKVNVLGDLQVDSEYVLTTKNVDSGVDGIWTWRELPTGQIECWGQKTWSNVACTTSAGGGYRSADQTVALPSGLFTAIESCQATMGGSGGSGYTMALRTLCNTTTVTQMFWNTSNTTKTSLTVDYYIIGT